MLNDDNQLLSHLKLVNKYDIKTTFLETITLHKCIPVDWLENLWNCTIKTQEVHTNWIVINYELLDLNKCKYKIFYSHIIHSNI